MDSKLKEAIGLIAELVEHLDYIGWGDSYEREPLKVNKLPDRADRFLEENECEEQSFRQSAF